METPAHQEVCASCNNPFKPDDDVYEVFGQKVHWECFAHFMDSRLGFCSEPPPVKSAEDDSL